MKRNYEANLALLRTHIDAGSFTDAWATGVAMSVEQAVTYALAIPTSG